MSSDLRKRSIKAGLVSGFFGQKNRNTKRKNDMADRVAELRESQELERSKTQYEASVKRTTKRRESEARMVAANGVDAEGNFNGQGWQLAGGEANPQWDTKSAAWQEQWIRAASKDGAVNATQWLNNLHGTVAPTAAVSDTIGGKSKHRSVQAATGAIVNQFGRINAGPQIKEQPSTTQKAVTQGEAQAKPADPYSFGSYNYQREFTSKTSTTPDGVVNTKTYTDTGETEVVPVMYEGKQLQSLENLPKITLEQTDKGLMHISSPIDGSTPKITMVLNEDGSPIRGEHGLQQADGIWTDGSGGAAVAVLFDAFAEEGERAYFSINKDGSRNTNVMPEGATAEQKRVQKATDAEEFFITSTKAYQKADDILAEYNPADHGSQGALNVLADNISGVYLNFFTTAQSGKDFSDEALETIGAGKDQEKARAAVNAHIRANLRGVLTAGMSDNEISERKTEIESILIKAALNNQVMGLTYLSATVYKGPGNKLNNNDLLRIDSLISLGDGPYQFIGGVTQLRNEMYKEAKQKNASIVARSNPDVADRMINTRYLRPTENNRAAGFISLIEGATAEEGAPIAVFVSSATAKPRLLTLEQHEVLMKRYNVVKEPTSVHAGSSRRRQ